MEDLWTITAIAVAKPYGVKSEKVRSSLNIAIKLPGLLMCVFFGVIFCLYYGCFFCFEFVLYVKW